MSNSKIYLPKKIKVGFNERDDTYTGKLGYVIYHDGKVWRKEKSWTTWCHFPNDTDYQGKPKKYKHDMTPLEFDNVLTEGFVLNKKVGGKSWSRNPRQTYCRVYDPRGFEFEVSIENLLWILDNSNCMMGKGLSGKFIYGWSGTELTLIPENSPEYSEMMAFTKANNSKVTKKDLEVGFAYQTKKMEEVVYLGYHMAYTVMRDRVYEKSMFGGNYKYTETIVKKKKHWFYDVEKGYITYRSNYTNLASKISESVVTYYAELAEALPHHVNFSPLNKEASYYELIEEKDYPVFDLDCRHGYYSFRENRYIFKDGKYLKLSWSGHAKSEGISYQLSEQYGDTKSIKWKGSLVETLKPYGFYRLVTISENGCKRLYTDYTKVELKIN